MLLIREGGCLFPPVISKRLPVTTRRGEARFSAQPVTMPRGPAIGIIQMDDPMPSFSVHNWVFGSRRAWGICQPREATYGKAFISGATYFRDCFFVACSERATTCSRRACPHGGDIAVHPLANLLPARPAPAAPADPAPAPHQPESIDRRAGDAERNGILH